MTIEPHQLRDSAYAARRALRHGDVNAYLRRNRKVDTPTVRRLAQIIEPLLLIHCTAQAEALAIETYLKELTP
jgi:hypothetical protein